MRIFVFTLADYLRRNTADDGKRWHVFGHYGTGGNDSPFPHGNARQNNYPRSDECIILYMDPA